MPLRFIETQEVMVNAAGDQRFAVVWNRDRV
jgi:hypothetical protein